MSDLLESWRVIRRKYKVYITKFVYISKICEYKKFLLKMYKIGKILFYNLKGEILFRYLILSLGLYSHICVIYNTIRI